MLVIEFLIILSSKPVFLLLLIEFVTVIKKKLVLKLNIILLKISLFFTNFSLFC